jgi:segregation and condensation protein B
MSEVDAAGNNDEKKHGLDSLRRQNDGEAEGLSLDKLNRAFAAMLGAGDDPYTVPSEPDDDPIRSAIVVEEQQAVNIAGRSPVDAGCEINPRSIVEVMLFVGTPDNRPLTARQIAGLMRGVRPAEVDELIADLNAGYAATGRPYRIVGEGAGYRFALAAEFEPIRDKFYGRIKQVRLSPAAIEVLAVVAYNEPLTADDVNRLRGTSSGPVLTQLVRRQLLRIERAAEELRAPRYFTTERFLNLFGVKSLAELPRSLDLERQ